MFEWQIKYNNLDNFTKIQRVLPINESSFHVYGSFGDVYIQIAVLKELLEEKKEKFNVIIEEKYANLVNNALGQNIGKYYADGGVNQLFNEIGLLGKTGNLPIRLLPTLYPGCSELIMAKRLYYSDFLRGIIGVEKKGYFSKIEDNDKLSIEAEQIIKAAGCEPGKTILLSLDNNTQKELTEEFWMRIIKNIAKQNKHILLNNSGTLSYKSASMLSELNIPKINVPPELAIALPTIAGGYIGGTNGFSTIQALFNDNIKGVHFINSIECTENRITDKFGNKFDPEVLYHSKTWKETFRKKQIEKVIDKETSIEEINNIIQKYIEVNLN